MRRVSLVRCVWVGRVVLQMRVLSDGLSELVAQQALRVALLMVVLADVAVCARSDGKQVSTRRRSRMHDGELRISRSCTAVFAK